jgi:hypothetical protein
MVMPGSPPTSILRSISIPPEARRAIDSLSRLGLRPSAPFEAVGFADPAIRAGWVAEKGMSDMQRSVGRPIDLRDVEELRAIAERKGGADG